VEKLNIYIIAKIDKLSNDFSPLYWP